MNLLDHLFQLDRQATRGDHLHFRFFEWFVAAYTVHFAWTWGLYIPRIDSVVLPLGIARYIDVSFLFSNGLSLVNAALITVLVTAGLLARVRWSYFAAFLLLHLQYAARYSLGEISHGSNMLGFSLLGLALAYLLFQKTDERRRFALGFTWFFIGLAYTSAGISKLIGTGPTWASGHHLWLWIHERGVDVLAGEGVFGLNIFQELLLGNWWLATAVLTFGWLTEAGGFLLWWRPTRSFITTALIGMHLGIGGSMNLYFTQFMLELLVIGYPWPPLIDKVLESMENKPSLSYRARS
jgi:hypothetical protein